jgi:EAL domain-containing protein (putative c-di-GMP-specific phosphodiesterase class I)
MGNAVTLGASIGVAAAGENGETGHDLLHAADLAMHQAQADGRNRIRRFEPAMRDRAKTRFGLESDLRAAIASQQVELQHALINQQFDVHYQPQVRIADGVLTGFEALLRWRHPERGMIRPDDFIAVAEDTGLIDLLGEWVLRMACREALGWHPAGDGPPLQVAVNVSALQLRSGNSLVADIARILAETGLPASRLEIELTETALADGIGDTLVAIRALGVDLALDDFGTGFSSLNQLRNHPFTRIKIDRSFVIGLVEHREDPCETGGEVMVRAIASLGRGLGLETIVEGVETPHQLAIARAAGCTTVQGFLVSRAVPASDVPALITRLHDGAALP